MAEEKQGSTATATPKKWCCDLHRTIVLGIAKVVPPEEGGLPLAELARFHDFGYTSQSNPPVPVALHIDIKFCPWCGTKRDPSHESRTVEMIHGMKSVVVRRSRDGEEPR
jgi:hypothetical protein